MDDEMKHHDQGMTILEVVIAITIFLIGVGFIAQSNGVAQRYRARQELRQQMIFYAAGQLEAMIEKKEGLSETAAPFNTFIVDTKVKATPIVDPTNGLPLPLQEIEVEVSATKNGVKDPNITSVKLKTYRVWTTP